MSFLITHRNLTSRRATTEQRSRSLAVEGFLGESGVNVVFSRVKANAGTLVHAEVERITKDMAKGGKEKDQLPLESEQHLARYKSWLLPQLLRRSITLKKLSPENALERESKPHELNSLIQRSVRAEVGHLSMLALLQTEEVLLSHLYNMPEYQGLLDTLEQGGGVESYVWYLVEQNPELLNFFQVVIKEKFDFLLQPYNTSFNEIFAQDPSEAIKQLVKIMQTLYQMIDLIINFTKQLKEILLDVGVSSDFVETEFVIKTKYSFPVWVKRYLVNRGFRVYDRKKNRFRNTKVVEGQEPLLWVNGEDEKEEIDEVFLLQFPEGTEVILNHVILGTDPLIDEVKTRTQLLALFENPPDFLRPYVESAHNDPILYMRKNAREVDIIYTFLSLLYNPRLRQKRGLPQLPLHYFNDPSLLLKDVIPDFNTSLGEYSFIAYWLRHMLWHSLHIRVDNSKEMQIAFARIRPDFVITHAGGVHIVDLKTYPVTIRDSLIDSGKRILKEADAAFSIPPGFRYVREALANVMGYIMNKVGEVFPPYGVAIASRWDYWFLQAMHAGITFEFLATDKHGRGKRFLVDPWQMRRVVNWMELAEWSKFGRGLGDVIDSSLAPGVWKIVLKQSFAEAGGKRLWRFKTRELKVVMERDNGKLEVRIVPYSPFGKTPKKKSKRSKSKFLQLVLDLEKLNNSELGKDLSNTRLAQVLPYIVKAGGRAYIGDLQVRITRP